MSTYDFVCQCCGSNLKAHVTDSEKVSITGHKETCTGTLFTQHDDIEMILQVHRETQAQKRGNLAC